MTALVRLSTVFEGSKLTTVEVAGRPAWVAREVGEAIGYAQRGKRFATRITGEWSGELLEGHDYRVVAGQELASLKEAVFRGTGSVPVGTSLVVLFESGLHLALVKTTKPAGIRLRRFLAEQVLPQLVRTGRYGEQPPPLAERREARLATRAQLEERRVEVLERRAAAQALRDTVRALYRLGQIDDTTAAAFEVQAAELVLGRALPALRPAGPTSWMTPTQIGRRLGLTAYTVGRIISELGLRGSHPELCRSYLTHVPECDEPVVCFSYSPEAVRRIESVVRAAA